MEELTKKERGSGKQKNKMSYSPHIDFTNESKSSIMSVNKSSIMEEHSQHFDLDPSLDPEQIPEYM